MADWSKIFDTGAKLLGTGATVAGGLASTGLFGSGGTDQRISSQDQTRDPWSAAVPYMTDAMRLSKNLYESGQGSEYYPGQTFTPMGADTSQGYNMARERAMAGSPTMAAANQGLQQMMGGDTNPYLDAMYGQGAKSITDSMKSLYSGAGRYGSPGMGRNIGETLGKYATNLYGGAYAGDQGRRLQAMQMAPGFAEQDYADAGRLLDIGQGVEGYQERERQGDIDKWNFYQQNPYDRLGQYANLASSMGGMGGTQTGDVTGSTQPGLTSIIGDIGSIGGALSDIWGGNNNNPWGGDYGGGTGTPGSETYW